MSMIQLNEQEPLNGRRHSNSRGSNGNFRRSSNRSSLRKSYDRRREIYQNGTEESKSDPSPQSGMTSSPSASGITPNSSRPRSASNAVRVVQPVQWVAAPEQHVESSSNSSRKVRDRTDVFAPLHNNRRNTEGATLDAKIQLAEVLHRQGNVLEAIRMYHIIAESYEESLGEEDPRTLSALLVLANAMREQVTVAQTFSYEMIIDNFGAYLESSNTSNPGRNSRISSGTLKVMPTSYTPACLLMRKSLSKQKRKSTSSPAEIMDRVSRQQGRLLRSTYLENSDANGPVKATIPSASILPGPEESDRAAADSKAIYNRVIELRQRLLGPMHVETLRAKAGLACLLLMLQEEMPKAEDLFQTVVDGFEVHLSPSNTDTLSAKMNLIILKALGGGVTIELKAVMEELIHAFEAEVGLDDTRTLQAKFNYAIFQHKLDNIDLALNVLRLVIHEREVKLGPRHVDTLGAQLYFANILRTVREQRQAYEIYNKLIDAYEDILGIMHIRTVKAKMHLSVMLKQQGYVSRAQALMQLGVESFERQLGSTHPETLNAKENLATLLMQQGDLAQSRAIYEGIIANREAKYGPNHPDTLRAKKAIAMLLAVEGLSTSASCCTIA